MIRRPGRSFRDRGKAIKEERMMLRDVPIMVASTVIP